MRKLTYETFMDGKEEEEEDEEEVAKKKRTVLT